MTPSDIMVVDDNFANLKLLEDMLAVIAVTRCVLLPMAAGAGLRSLKNRRDLILLDINMPEMNGHGSCGGNNLMSSDELSSVPVIFFF